MGELGNIAGGGRRILVRALIVVEAFALVATGVSVVALAGRDAVIAADFQPAELLHGFTVVVSGDADLQHGSGGGEIEGSIAVGGDLTFGTYQLTAPTQPGTPLPSVDGAGVQVLVGGTIPIDGGSSKLDANAGRVRVTDTAGMTVSPDRRLYRDDLQRYVLNQSSLPQSTVGDPASASDYTATPGAFTQTFDGAFAELRSISASLHALTAEDGAAIVVPVNDGGKWAITLVPNAVNVLRTDTASLAAVSEVNFQGGTVPGMTTPLIVDVTDSTGTSVRTPRFNGGTAHHAPYILWNFSGWSSLTLSAGGGEMGGGVLAPDADVLFARSVLFEGQIAAASIVIRGSAEIHHWGFLSTITTPTPTPTPTETTPPPPGPASGEVRFTDETCETLAGWSYQILPGEHVSYSMTVEGSTTPVDPGTYVPRHIGVEYVISAVADDGFEIVGADEWRHTFTYAEGCLVEHPLAYGLVSATHATCRGDTNSFTVVAVEGIAYELTLDGTTTSLAPGTVTTVRLGTLYRITATPVDPYALDPGYPSSWSFTFEAPVCLPTLSFTGVSPWLYVLGIGGTVSVVLGVTIILLLWAGRRRPRTPENA